MASKSSKCRIICDTHAERRPFTAKDAARIICYAREGGATWDDIKREAAERCLIEDLDCDCQRLKSLLEATAAAMAVLAVLLGLFTPVGKIGQGLAVLVKGSKLPVGDGLRVLTRKEYLDLLKANRVMPESQELLRKAINELSLAQREAFRLPRIIIKEP